MKKISNLLLGVIMLSMGVSCKKDNPTPTTPTPTTSYSTDSVVVVYKMRTNQNCSIDSTFIDNNRGKLWGGVMQYSDTIFSHINSSVVLYLKNNNNGNGFKITLNTSGEEIERLIDYNMGTRFTSDGDIISNIQSSTKVYFNYVESTTKGVMDSLIIKNINAQWY
jgi:hypothetical protein